MRALFRHLLKGSGTPVLQTLGADGETILSAGNIWTSAHVRRIELTGEGLKPGDMVCSAAGGFASVIDFVACAIGGFVYLPVAAETLSVLRHQLTAGPADGGKAMLLIDGQRRSVLHRSRLPAALRAIEDMPDARLALIVPDRGDPLGEVELFTSACLEARLAGLSGRLGTPAGGSRLSCSMHHQGRGFVVDLLLGLYTRQTLYLRTGERRSAAALAGEVIALAIDDLVMAPAMLAAFARDCRSLPWTTRAALAPVRAHTGGKALTRAQHALIASVFDTVLVETLQGADPSPVAIGSPRREAALLI